MWRNCQQVQNAGGNIRINFFFSKFDPWSNLMLSYRVLEQSKKITEINLFTFFELFDDFRNVKCKRLQKANSVRFPFWAKMFQNFDSFDFWKIHFWNTFCRCRMVEVNTDLEVVDWKAHSLQKGPFWLEWRHGGCRQPEEGGQSRCLQQGGQLRVERVLFEHLLFGLSHGHRPIAGQGQTKGAQQKHSTHFSRNSF